MSASIQEQVEDLLSESVESAIQRERNSLDEILQDHDGRFVLFGAGNLGRRACTCLLQAGYFPLAFSDNNPRLWGTCIGGIRVLSPAEAAREYGRDAAFFVTIWNDKHRFSETRSQLRSLGCAHVLSASSIYWRFATDFLPNLCQDLPRKLYEQEDRIRHASGLWADYESEAEFLAQLRWRAYGNFEALQEPASDRSYFLDEVFSPIPEEVFVDCGAFDGDTIRDFASWTHGSFLHAFAIESDPDNFRMTREYLAANPLISRRVSTLNVAVGSENPLDDLVRNPIPTFIKMDIEGSEIEAVSGAAAIIAEHRPILAICSYHRQSDLWEIPLRIRDICSSYYFFLRQHDPDAWQLVTYAVPQDRLRPN